VTQSERDELQALISRADCYNADLVSMEGCGLDRTKSPGRGEVEPVKPADPPAALATRSPGSRAIWEFVASCWSWLRNVFINVAAVITVLFIIYVVWDTVTQKAISVAPLTVTKTLDERGYTPDVAANRLESAIKDTIEIGHIIKTGPGVLQQNEAPKIVVPSTGWSVDVIASYIRTLLHIEGPWNVSGDITESNKKLWLHLRMNGRDLFESTVGVDLENPDALFAEAARRVIERADPYTLAASINRIDPNNSLKVLNRIISYWPTTDINVAWAHNLRGTMLGEQGKKKDAVAEYYEAIRLQPRFGLAYTDLSYGLLDENKPQEALAASQEGIELDPQSPPAHSAKCYILDAMKKLDEAKVECETSLSILKKLVETDPYNASAWARLGFILRRMGRWREAMTAFRATIEIAPHDVLTHIDLGRGLLLEGDLIHAMAEFQVAITLNPNLPSAHEDLGALLHKMGDHVGADLEADKALALREGQESEDQQRILHGPH
jgi:tetratricopeptide (TPR) repeat protein